MSYQTLKMDVGINNVHKGGISGEALVCGDLVYLDSNGAWKKAQAVALASQNRKDAMAIAWKNSQVNEYISPVKVLDIKGFTGLTIGKPVYLSATSGGITQTHPGNDKITQVVGVATTSTTVRIEIGTAQEADSGDETKSLTVSVLDEEITLDGSASYSLSDVIPKNAVILSARANAQTVVTATTATAFGIGIASDVDKYGESSALTKNTKITTAPDYAVISSAEIVRLYATDGSGSAAGTLNTGTVRVRIEYTECDALADA